MKDKHKNEKIGRTNIKHIEEEIDKQTDVFGDEKNKNWNWEADQMFKNSPYNFKGQNVV